ncbi:MAG: sporulation protein YqfD [Clostridia bacterium]|nr:sporulation protein YqfD [Clostridia bacterium]
MLFKIMLSYIIGYVRVIVEGYYIERFVNICTNNKIIIWNLKRDKDVNLYLNVGIKDFKKIIKIAKKTKCKISIIKKKGIPFIINKYRKRKFFIFLLILLIILLGVSSNFIWNVEIKEENNNELIGIEQDLKEVGLKSGIAKYKINIKDVINKINLKRNDIAWMGIELKGTNAIVKIVKADEKPEIISDDEYCNIVSDKAGVITKIIAQDGTAQVKEGDTVNKGTILISGWIEGKYTGIRYVHSKGEIQAKVWHTKNKTVNLNQKIKEKTGNVQNSYKIKINNFEINLLKRVSKFKFYDTINEEKRLKIFSDFYLPISIIKTTYEEENYTEKTYTQEEAKKLVIKELEEELENEIEIKENILNKNINLYEKDNQIEIYVTYEVLENIGTKEKIVF